MADQRRKRVVRLLAEDGRLQALLSFSQADLGQLAMAGGILLQSGWQSTRYERKQSEVIDTDEKGIPDYGSLVIRLSASSPLMSVLSSSIWSPKSDYLRECLYAIIDKKSAHADAAPHVSARQSKAVQSKPRRSARTRVEPRAHAPSANAPILVDPEHKGVQVAEQRQRRTIRLLEDDGPLQVLLSRSPAEIGHLAMVGDILLQGGLNPDRSGHAPASVIETDANGDPDYGSLSVRLNRNDPLTPGLSPSIWFMHGNRLRECLRAIIDLHPALVGLEDAAPRPRKVRQSKAGPSKPKRSKRTQAESRTDAPPANASILGDPEPLVPPAPHPSVSQGSDEPEALTSWDRLSSWVAGRR